MDDSLDGLRAFLEVAAHSSFTLAARALSITPTAVSQQIKQLEARLGVVLFVRTTRRVALTEPGQELFARLKPALSSVDEALSSLSVFRGRPSGTIRLTAPRSAAVRYLVPIIERMRAAYPELKIELSLNDAFVDLVSEGFDAGLRLGDSVEKDMLRVPVTRASAWSIVASPDYLARHGRPSAPEDLVHHVAVRQRLIASGVVYRWELTRRGKELTVDVPTAVVVDDLSMMVALACAGVGLAYVPDEPALEELATGRLERVLVPYMTPGPGYHLYFPARAQEQPKLRALIEVVRSLYGASRARRRQDLARS